MGPGAQGPPEGDRHGRPDLAFRRARRWGFGAGARLRRGCTGAPPRTPRLNRRRGWMCRPGVHPSAPAGVASVPAGRWCTGWGGAPPECLLGSARAALSCRVGPGPASSCGDTPPCPRPTGPYRRRGDGQGCPRRTRRDQARLAGPREHAPSRGDTPARPPDRPAPRPYPALRHAARTAPRPLHRLVLVEGGRGGVSPQDEARPEPPGRARAARAEPRRHPCPAPRPTRTTPVPAPAVHSGRTPAEQTRRATPQGQRCKPSGSPRCAFG